MFEHHAHAWFLTLAPFRGGHVPATTYKVGCPPFTPQCSLSSSWLTMQRFSLKKRKSSKPLKEDPARLQDLADGIESDPNNEAMVKCSECVRHNKPCYYDREQSVKCSECLRHQRKCDGTFSLEEYRKVGAEKRRVTEGVRRKHKEMARLRRVMVEARHALLAAEGELAAVEEDNVKLEEDLSVLEDKSNKMLQRELLALGVLNSFEVSQEVAPADPAAVWGDLPVTEQVDWSAVFGMEAPSLDGLVSPLPVLDAEGGNFREVQG